MRKLTVLDRRRKEPSFGRRHTGRPASPQQTISDFGRADRNMRGKMRTFHQIRSRLGIRNVTNANLARLGRAWRSNPRKRALLRQLSGMKPKYVSSLKESALARRLLKFRLVRDPKFVQIENLAAFTHNVFRIMRSCEANGRQYSMAILDIDKFKRINDSFGHGVGDVVISEMASMLSAFAKKHGGAAARVGGEEFRVFVSMAPDKLSRELVALKSAFSNALARPERRGTKPINGWNQWTAPTFSAGISARKGNGRNTLDAILSRISTESDAALYRAKEKRNSVAVFH